MEGNSQDEDPDEALKEYYAKQKEKRKKYDEKKGGKKSVLGEAKSADKDGQDMHEGNTLDHTKLFTLTSAGEDKHTSSNLEGIPPHHFTLHVWGFKPLNTTYTTTKTSFWTLTSTRCQKLHPDHLVRDRKMKT